MKKISLLFVLIFCFSLVLADSQQEEITLPVESDPYGQIKLLDMVQTQIEASKKAAEDILSGVLEGDPVGEFAIFNAMTANSWFITRAIAYGFNDFQAAADYFNSETGLLKAITMSRIGSYINLCAKVLVSKKSSKPKGQGNTKPTITIQEAMKQCSSKSYEELEQMLHRALSARGSGVLPNDLKQAFNELGVNTRELVERYLKYGQWLEEIAAMNLPGLGNEWSIFKRMQLISIVILFIGMTVRMGQILYGYGENKNRQTPTMTYQYTLLNTAIFLLLIIYLDTLAFTGIRLSDMVKGMILTDGDTINQEYSSGQKSGIVMSKVQNILKLRAEMLEIKGENTFTLGDFLSKKLGSLMGYIAYMLAAAAIYVLLILGDVMMGIVLALGPLMVALSMFSWTENYFKEWVKGYITFLFYGPMAAVFSILLIAILAMGIDSSLMTFIIICITYIYGATKIPNIAESMSGGTLSGIATTLAMLPAMASLRGLSSVGSSVVGGASSLLKGDKNNAVPPSSPSA